MARNAISYFRNHKKVQGFINWAKQASLPFMGGLPLYWVGMFFVRNLSRESISLRASSIAFNLFLSLFPALIFLFTLLPYIPIKGLDVEVYTFLGTIMPSSAFANVEDILNDIIKNSSTKLLSVGIIAALYFASNGVYSLMQTFDNTDNRSYWQQKFISIWLTLFLGLVLLVGLLVFLITSYILVKINAAAPLDINFKYYLVLDLQWFMVFLLLFGSTILVYYHGDSRVTKIKYILPGAFLTSVLVMLISIAYSYYVNKWANYSKLYGSLGAMIITMLWLYFNSNVIIIGHEFNRALLHTKLSLVRKPPVAKNIESMEKANEESKEL